MGSDPRRSLVPEPGPPPSPATRRRGWPWAAAAGVAAAVAYGLLVSFTHPFTADADALTAFPLAVGLLLTIRTWRVGTRRRGAPGGSAVTVVRARLWLVPIAAVLSFELYCYANLPRARYPTLSALIDMLDSTRAGKTLAVAAWLVLGWFLAVR